MRTPPLLFLAVLLASCGGPGKKPAEEPLDLTGRMAMTSVIKTPQNPPVEFGKRPPNTKMTKDDMPFFDAVAYCELTTRKSDKIWRGPHYEACVEDQAHYRLIIGQAIDAAQYKEPLIIHCAKASRSAYQGMWYCMNGQPF